METPKPDFPPINLYRFLNWNCLKEKLPSVRGSSFLNHKYKSIKPTVQFSCSGGMQTVDAHHCSSFRTFLLVPPASPEALLHTASFKCPYLICDSRGRSRSRGPCSRQGKWSLGIFATWEASWLLKWNNNYWEENSHPAPILSLDVITVSFIIIFFQPWQ